MNKVVFNGVSFEEMKDFLEEKHLRYNQHNFIANDPISIPHMFSRRQDIEISGFLTATIAWGRRDQIIKSARELMCRMGMSPHEFLINASDDDLEAFNNYYYRTFQGEDCIFFLSQWRKESL